MIHKLPHLPFAKDALHPHISAETIEFHYGKHHKGYIDKLNELIVGTPFETTTLEEIVCKADGQIFNQGAQAWNHNFYWQSLTPHKHEIPQTLLRAITVGFNDVDRFKSKFMNAAQGIFGSGWVWLVCDPRGRLLIKTTSNANNPLRHGFKPLLTCDVWEHAYYIDWRNERSKYLTAIWHLMNWDFAASNFEHLIQEAA